MIVCVCHNVSEKTIQRAYESGLTRFADLREELEVGTCCGKCAGCARKVLRDCVEKQESRPSGMQILLHKLHLNAESLAV